MLKTELYTVEEAMFLLRLSIVGSSRDYQWVLWVACTPSMKVASSPWSQPLILEYPVQQELAVPFCTQDGRLDELGAPTTQIQKRVPDLFDGGQLS